jgi:hypothetical protein
MTISEYVEGRAMWIRMIGCIWVVGALVVMIVVFPSVSSANTVPTLLGEVFLGVIICTSLAALTKCPRCGASLGDITYQTAKPFTDDVPDHCPKCGVSLEEPMESSANRQQQHTPRYPKAADHDRLHRVDTGSKCGIEQGLLMKKRVIQWAVVGFAVPIFWGVMSFILFNATVTGGRLGSVTVGRWHSFARSKIFLGH